MEAQNSMRESGVYQHRWLSHRLQAITLGLASQPVSRRGVPAPKLHFFVLANAFNPPRMISAAKPPQFSEIASLKKPRCCCPAVRTRLR